MIEHAKLYSYIWKLIDKTMNIVKFVNCPGTVLDNKSNNKSVKIVLIMKISVLSKDVEKIRWNQYIPDFTEILPFVPYRPVRGLRLMSCVAGQSVDVFSTSKKYLSKIF